MYSIFIVEDDETIAHSLKKHLESWDFTVFCAGNFKEVIEEFTSCKPHLVLMDITLPFYNGYHWCAKIREVSKVPVMFLSSSADNMNVLMAINMGADDFIAKPFDLHILTAKVQALLRRTYSFTPRSEILAHKGMILNIDDGSFTYNEKRFELTKNEFRILLTLFENKGKIVSRDTLMNRLWSDDCFVDDNTLTVNVNRLRKKLEDAGNKGFIGTKKGEGYIV
ncbi:MAG: response regulator transcription factor [Spirochaetaceae bacterium]|jgi:DNA-binding response OmpR family regulator|nr:response regulator transcription factor [Spirochaetaceae bacterium]HPX27672.1 response regulator transcription factor [Treponemataceae bacterium]